MKSMKNTKLPALNNESLREQQMTRFTEGIGNLGDYAKELKESQKWSARVGIFYLIMMVIIVLTVIVVAFVKGDGLDGIMDMKGFNRHFNCTSSDGVTNDELRLYADVEHFHNVYGGNCVLYVKE